VTSAADNGHMRSRVASTALALTVVVALIAPVGEASAQIDRRPRVVTLLDHRLADARLGQVVSMIVIDADSGAVVFERKASRTMQPASNMKIVTAVNALAVLGPGKRFATRVLRGDSASQVILQGAGDPLLSRQDLQVLAARTAKGLDRKRTITVHVDGDLFPRHSPAPGWLKGFIGGSIGYVEALAIHGDRSRQPSRNAARVFVAGLRRLGYTVRIGGHRDAAANATVLARFRGHSVAAAVAAMLTASDSPIAEVLFRQVALALGRPPTWRGSQRAAKEALRELGVDPTGLVLADGSGLSRDDRVSPRFLASLLRLARIQQASRFATMFRAEAMPVAGRSGTLGIAFGRYTTSPSRCARGAVQAKTGTILRTIALSGVARTSSGGRRIFSIIVNERPLRYSALDTRRAVDGLAATVVGCW
jgi:D-alanyl-D-alanine carboxypeptidase/D-alanyl-D-alanine-endopeptidase (penicillin-binding protein 4)